MNKIDNKKLSLSKTFVTNGFIWIWGSAHTETTGWGGSYSKKLGELSLVDSDSTRREEHAYISHSSG